MLDGLVRRILLGRARGKVADMLGTNWKGKAGAIGVMLTGVAGMLTGAGCIAQHLVVEGNLGQWDRCWELLAGGFATFSAGLAAYGIRDAMGPSAKTPASPSG
jgi:hypothetical protein